MRTVRLESPVCVLISGLLASAAWLIDPGPAIAQPAPSAPAAPQSQPVPADAAPAASAQPAAEAEGGIQEIVVTARKRVESAQDIPVSVTALSDEQLQRFDLTNLEKVSTQTPQFTVGRASNGSGAQLSLRGIGSSSTSIGIEQSVAVVVDGVYYGQGRIINEGFFDLGRIEILKGPQALFFGKNATAGVVSITTADPGDEVELLGRVGYEFKAQNLIGEAVGSGPVGENFGVRLAVRGSNMFDGYFNNRGLDKIYPTFDVATGVTTPHFAPGYTRDEPGESELLGRLTVKWEPTDRLDITLKASGTRNRTDNNSWNYVTFACPTGVSSLNPSIPCQREFNVYQNFIPEDLAGSQPFTNENGHLYNKYDSYAFTGTINYDLDDITLTSVTNYNRNKNRWACDCIFISSDLAAAPSSERSIFHAFSNETRAQTAYDGPVNLLAGFYYQSTKRDHTQTGAFGNVEDSSVAPELRYLAYFKRSETEGETIAGFGQVIWRVVPEVELTGGVRYTHETKDSFLVQPYVNALLTSIFLPNTTITGDQTFDNWSPEITVTYQPTEAITVYGAYKTAYKSGGFSNSGFVSATTIPSDVAFEPEKARGFEGGIKTMLFDRQLRFNVGLYRYKYTDLQVDYFNSATFAFITTNAGAAKTRGVEVEAEYAPNAIEGLTIQGTANYNKARYSNYIAPCYGGQSIEAGCNTTFQGAFGQDLSGKPTAVAPKWTASLGVNYEAPVSDSFIVGLAANARYSDDYLASSFAHPLSRQPSYVSLDASARVRTADEQWELALIGRNLTNRFIVTGVVDGPNTGTGTGGPASGAIPADQVGFVSLPRTVQVQLTWRY